jgi:hypothetical protein
MGFGGGGGGCTWGLIVKLGDTEVVRATPGGSGGTGGGTAAG